ncbi:MAG: hypothetical protein K0S54_3631, partial [Alphaproteobacteria bacterium]|nr:hypothetical protein [Alphaproteobacteria bacterium]
MLSRSLAAAALFTAVALPAAAQELSLKRVMLSSGGIGYFEHEAEVDGNAELKLNVRLDQVDDVLKSLVVYDDRGGIGGVSLPGKEPLTEAFRGLPFSQEALGSLATLVQALQGAEITVSGPRVLSGRVVAVTPEITTSGNGLETRQRHRVSVLTVDGVMQQFVLEEAQDLQFNDPALRRQIGEALAAVRENRARDSRTVTVSLRGTGKRIVRAAYVVSVPVWKAAYRVTLPADVGATRAGMQGWAVLENMTGADWSNVELTLVSGSPVTFRQALYEAYYVNRPEVPVEVVGRILPRPDQGGVLADMVAQEQDQRRQRGGPMPPPAAPPPAGAFAKGEAMASRAPLPAQVAGAVDVAASAESFTQVSFRFPQPISIGAGRTLSVPIIDRELPVRRLALYQPETNARHPLAAIELRNDGTTGLPPGVLTIYERGAATGQAAYVGDARLSGLPVGDKRLLSYALDTRTIVEREVDQTRRIAKGSILNGVFRYTTALTQTVSWRVKPPANEGRNMLFEHAGAAGWTVLRPDPKIVEISENRFRVPATIPAGTQTKVELVMERPVEESISLVSAASEIIAAFARNTELDKPTRDAFARIVTLQNDVARHQQRLTQLDNERKTIVSDQERLRG